MTVPAQSSQSVFLGNGMTSTWTFPWSAVSTSYINVFYVDSSGTWNTLSPTQYNITLNAPAPGQLWGVGGTITYPLSSTPIANGTSLIIQRAVPYSQQTNVANQTAYPVSVQTALDTLCFEIQQLASRTGQFRGVWASGVQYNFGDMIQDGVNGAYTNNYYMCVTANLSGTWSTDLTNGDWVLAFNVQGLNSIIGAYLPLTGGKITGNLTVTGSLTASGLPTLLSTNTTFYVSTSGSDSNTGTSSSPWATIQHALNTIQSQYDLAGHTATITVANGTYTGANSVVGSFTGGGSVIVTGTNTTGVIISTTGSNAFSASAGAQYTVQNMKLTTTTSGSGLYATDNGSQITLGSNIEFGVCASPHITATSTGKVQAAGTAYTISGNAPFHVGITVAASVNISNCTVTLTGTPAFSGAFAYVVDLSFFYAAGNTYTGSATGSRFILQTNSVIDAGGAGANYFPGNVAGSYTVGAAYDGTSSSAQKANNLSDLASSSAALTNLGIGSIQSQTAKAWVKFVGNTATVLGSYNVTSVTRVSAGVYTVAITSALADANAAVNVTAYSSGGNYAVGGGTTSASAVAIVVAGNGSGAVDPTNVSVSVFR